MTCDEGARLVGRGVRTPPRMFAWGKFDRRVYAGYSWRMHCANEHRVRQLIALFGLLAMVLSGLHAGSLAAHGSEHSGLSVVGGETHTHGHADHDDAPSDSDSSADLALEQGHHHSPSVAAPHLPGSDLERRFGKQIVFASETSLLHSGSPAPPLDPPIA